MRPPSRFKQIVSHLHLTFGSGTALLDRLERAAYIHRIIGFDFLDDHGLSLSPVAEIKPCSFPSTKSMPLRAAALPEIRLPSCC
jgi:hypothetical protein